MKAPGKVQITVWSLGLAGAALFTFLLIRQGASQVVMAFAAAGWAIAAVVIYHFVVPVVLDAIAWQVLFPKPDRLPLRKLLWIRWIGESVSTLVPSAAVGCNQWCADAGRGRDCARGHHSGSFDAGRIYRARCGATCRCNWTEKFRSSNLSGNINRRSWCCGFLFRATARNVPFSRPHNSTFGEFAGMALSGAERRDARSYGSHALRSAACTRNVLRVDIYFADRWFRRNLDRTLCAQPSRNVR